MSTSPPRQEKKFLAKNPYTKPDLHRAIDMTCIHTTWQWTASIVAVAVLVLLTAHGAFCQSAAFATFTGRALDPQGASIPGATLTATNVETGIVRTTQTTSDGLYRFDNLPPGVYDVVIEAR